MTGWRKRQIADKAADDEPKELKVVIAPGAFDSFEGTQEELDALQAEIMAMFANKTPEELMAESRPITIEDLEEMVENGEEAEVKQILRAIGVFDGDSDDRKLQ
jgi:hemolysin activation/secretion protein